MAHTLTIEYSDDILLSAGMTQEDFDTEARFLLAAKLHEMGKLSSGQAATLCGKERVAFLYDLPRAGVSINNLRPEDAADEVAFLSRA